MFLMITILILIFSIFIIIKKSEHKSNYKDVESELIYDQKAYDEATKNIQDYDEKYFERINNRESYQQFLLLGEQQDCSIIRSLLSANEIPSYRK